MAAATLAGVSRADEPAITVDNEARVPAAQLEPILADFNDWRTRVHAYYGTPQTPVTLKLTREVPFGFYRGGIVLLPPGERQAMLEDWVHELTHHVLGRESSFFFREGAATHSVDVLFARAGMTPRGWPYFGQSCDAWTALFATRGQLRPLAEMLAWPRYQGETAEQDFRSWQIYLAGCSFVGATFARGGQEAFRAAFAADWSAQDSVVAQEQWLRAVAARKPAPFDPAKVLPRSKRYRNYAERLGS